MDGHDMGRSGHLDGGCCFHQYWDFVEDWQVGAIFVNRSYLDKSEETVEGIFYLIKRLRNLDWE